MGTPESSSADAVPALVELPEIERWWTIRFLREDLRDGDPWSSTNLSRVRARRLLGLHAS